MQTLRNATRTITSVAGLYRELALSSLQLLPMLRELTRYESRAPSPALGARIGAPSPSGSV